MRRLLPCTVLVALLTACGGDDAPPAGRPAQPPAQTPTAASPMPSAVASSAKARAQSPATESPLSKERAAAIAESITLRPGDLPGTTVDSAATEGADDDDPFAACVKTTTPLASADSIGLMRGRQPEVLAVGNTTDVVPTSEAAASDFAALTEPSVLPCLDREIAALFSGEDDGTSTRGAMKRVPTSKPADADAAARYVYEGTISGPGASLKVYVGVSAVVVGRAEISLVEFGAGRARLSNAERDRLVAALVRRANSAQHLRGL